MRNTAKMGWVVTLAMATALLVPTVSTAGPGVARSGVHCRAQATRLGDEITVTFWLRGARAHREWRIRIWHDDRLAASASRVTTAVGSARVRVGVENLPGVDVFRFRAVHPSSGSRCVIDDLRV